MRIGTDERIRIVDVTLAEHALREIFKIHLMHDADAGRHNLESFEGLHAPFQKLIALTIAGKFQIKILG